MLKKPLTYFFLLILLMPLVFVSSACSEAVMDKAEGRESTVASFDDCVRAGSKVLRTFPARCVHAGVVYVQGKDAHSGEGSPAQGGICVDHCGNGRCEQIVCMAAGCPCPESHQSCPADCSP